MNQQKAPRIQYTRQAASHLVQAQGGGAKTAEEAKPGCREFPKTRKRATAPRGTNRRRHSGGRTRFDQKWSTGFPNRRWRTHESRWEPTGSSGVRRRDRVVNDETRAYYARSRVSARKTFRLIVTELIGPPSYVVLLSANSAKLRFHTQQ